MPGYRARDPVFEALDVGCLGLVFLDVDALGNLEVSVPRPRQGSPVAWPTGIVSLELAVGPL